MRRNKARHGVAATAVFLGFMAFVAVLAAVLSWVAVHTVELLWNYVAATADPVSWGPFVVVVFLCWFSLISLLMAVALIRYTRRGRYENSHICKRF